MMISDDINLFYMDMPANVRAAVTINEDDSYSVFVNQNLSIETQREAALHELNHAIRGDLLRDVPAEQKEKEIREEMK